jgi:hypothetical protein
MATYTEYELHLTLGTELPKDIINVIEFMLSGKTYYPETSDIKLPDHPLFKTKHWDDLLSGEAWLSERGKFETSFVKTDNGYKLDVLSDVINYDNEISLFLSLLMPYVTSGGLCGWMTREDDEYRTIIFNDAPYEFKFQKILSVEETVISYKDNVK